MNCTVDWKFVVALGLATAGIIFSMKTDAEDAKEVLIHAVDACKEWPSGQEVSVLLMGYLNITPAEIVSVYGKGIMSVSPSSIVTNTEYTSSPCLCSYSLDG